MIRDHASALAGNFPNALSQTIKVSAAYPAQPSARYLLGATSCLPSSRTGPPVIKMIVKIVETRAVARATLPTDRRSSYPVNRAQATAQ